MKRSLTLAAFLVAMPLFAGDWPQFRGPNSSGVADEKNLPATWSPTQNVLWKATVPGRSVSSPVVAGGRVYVASASGVRKDKLNVLCFDAKNGQELWRRQLNATGNTGCHPKSSMAAPTPVASADGVYVLFATADLAAFDKDGNLRWYRSLAGDYPAIANQVGMASSPILHDGTLIVSMDTVGESFLAGLDVKDGRNAWKIERPRDINWVTPLIRSNGGVKEVLIQSRFGLAAHDVGNGRRLWNWATEGGTVPTPALLGDQILMSVTAKGLNCLTQKGQETPEVAWTSQKLASGRSTPLVYQGHIYNVSGAGVLVCADTKGKEIWDERLKKGAYYPSPIAADGKIFVCNDEGICTVLRAGGETAEVLGTNDLKEEIMGTPAIADGAIYIQTVSSIYCIKK